MILKYLDVNIKAQINIKWNVNGYLSLYVSSISTLERDNKDITFYLTYKLKQLLNHPKIYTSDIQKI